MSLRIFYFLLILASILFSACGPNKELIKSQARNDSIQAVVSQLNGQISGLGTEIKNYKDSLKYSQARYQQLNDQYAVAMHEASDCRQARQAIAQRLELLNQAMAANGISMKEIRRKAAEALVQFLDAGMDVTYKNGLVYISMEDELIFNPGSARLGKRGQEALSVVARVLNDNPNLLIYVVGNTDSIKISKGFTDNWSLSTERANSVVRVLRDDYQVSMDRVTAAGRGKYNPIADNSTPEGRAKNRRTDIILNPDLSRLWDLIDKQE